MGITIASLNGENGLINKTKLAKQKYEVSETKEKLELAIATLRIEQEGKGETLTKEDLPKLNNDEIDVGSVENFPIEVICKNYKFNIDENLNAIYIGEANQTIVTYTTVPDGYINQDSITVKIKITNSAGIETILYPDGKKDISCNGKKTVGIDYIVNKNGTYVFKITDKNGKETEKEIVIQKIDKVNPEISNVLIEDITTNSFTIKVNAKDGEATDESIKSGIEKYEYFVKKNDEETQGNYIVNGLDQETEYIVYVVAYDKAGNFIQTEEVKVETLINNKTYLYKTGNNYTELTGGWKFIQQANVDCSENNQYIKIWATDSNGSVATLTTNNSIELKGFSKIKFEMNDVCDFFTAYPSSIGVSEQVEDEWPTLIKELKIGKSNEKTIYELDISNLNERYYPVIKGAMKAYIYRIWLEK